MKSNINISHNAPSVFCVNPLLSSRFLHSITVATIFLTVAVSAKEPILNWSPAEDTSMPAWLYAQLTGCIKFQPPRQPRMIYRDRKKVRKVIIGERFKEHPLEILSPGTWGYYEGFAYVFDADLKFSEHKYTFK